MDATLRPDQKHRDFPAAPATGTLAQIRDSAHVRRGDTLAMIAPDSPAPRRRIPVLSPYDGTWTPRRRNGQFVWDGDTVGVVLQHGFWWAVGTVSDINSRYVHPGDPARVVLGDHRQRTARVEWIEPPSGSRYWADVAVEFAAPEAAFSPGTAATAIIAPAHLRDSLPAVPAASVVQFKQGAALFARVRPREYELRWVVVGPGTDRLVSVRGDVIPGSLIVAGGLARLANLARDSLERRGS